MHEIFVNYRTKGGKETAYLCDQALSARFGRDSVFLAKKSIELGDNYAGVLDGAVRRCRVLLALIHEGWADTPDRDRPDRPALHAPQDWVRREIEEALASGALIVPVFIGRHVEQLDPRRLPQSIAELAECQYTRVELATFDDDITRLGDRLSGQIPALAALDKTRPAEQRPAPEQPPAVRNDHQRGGIGNVGTYVNDAHGPMNTGSGPQYNAPHITGDGNNYVAGDNAGGIRMGFGTRTPRGGEGR
ncbi:MULTISPECIES: TIR domain-containing protein [unclassified Streptomyces]|uniref:TIR domain-containing protein n=1 Tax=unclassified Streptomyces TaxID=2593676 RepID=UPI000DD899D4|nr:MULTISPECIES: TIR domain-containing protein [unclassified Streptomyces]QZZ26703.1 TIR domain-containing protein [Streptomyces sp. ST1015]